MQSYRKAVITAIFCCLVLMGSNIYADVPFLGIPTSGTITQLFLDPINYEHDTEYYDKDGKLQPFKGNQFHHGLDIAKSEESVYAAQAGNVVFSGLDGTLTTGYGHTVVIYHGMFNIDGKDKHLYTFYGHMGTKEGESYVIPKKGDKVVAGQKIGKQGNSGYTVGVTGIHLDWEIRLSSSSPDKLDWTLGTHRGDMIAASPDFFTNQQLTNGDPIPLTVVISGPFYSCQFNRKDPATQITMYPGETRDFVVSYTNTTGTDWKSDESNPNYIELRSVDLNGNPADSFLYPGDGIWVANDKRRVVSQDASNVGPGQNAWFIFNGNFRYKSFSDFV